MGGSRGSCDGDGLALSVRVKDALGDIVSQASIKEAITKMTSVNIISLNPIFKVYSPILILAILSNRNSIDNFYVGRLAFLTVALKHRNVTPSVHLFIENSKEVVETTK
jgi:hypothetical protein